MCRNTFLQPTYYKKDSPNSQVRIDSPRMEVGKMRPIQININIGSIKIVSMSTASTFAIGQSGIANRNNSKTNSGPSTIADGTVYMPVGKQVTFDPDQLDAPEWGGHHVVMTPQS